MFPLRLDRRPTRTPWVTWSIMLVCGLAFLYQVVQPVWMQREIMEQFALVPARFTAMFALGFDPQAIEMLVTSMFMHAGLPHIVFNLWYLHVFGDSLEEQLGSARYGVLYITAGVVAGLVQIAVNPYSPVPMVGASGAIAGVLAAHIIVRPRARVVAVIFPLVFFTVELPAFVLVAVWFVMQFFAGLAALGVKAHGGVAYWAHIGGFVAGLALAPLVKPRSRRRADDDRDEDRAGARSLFRRTW